MQNIHRTAKQKMQKWTVLHLVHLDFSLNQAWIKTDFKEENNQFQILKNNLSTILLKAIYLENGPIQS